MSYYCSILSSQTMNKVIRLTIFCACFIDCIRNGIAYDCFYVHLFVQYMKKSFIYFSRFEILHILLVGKVLYWYGKLNFSVQKVITDTTIFEVCALFSLKNFLDIFDSQIKAITVRNLDYKFSSLFIRQNTGKVRFYVLDNKIPLF